MASIKQQLLDVFSDLNKSAEDVNYYRIRPWSKSSTIKGKRKSNNIFDFMLILDELDGASHLSLGIIIFHDNTCLLYDTSDHEWIYFKTPSYNKLMGEEYND